MIIAEQEYHGKTQFMYIDDEYIVEKLQLTKDNNARRLYKRNDLFEIITELKIENAKLAMDKLDPYSY